ncbi:hypothetical protein GUJ93_ZPchr0004g38692 [Zizania palustris]|uniref:Uncharacterized protein n=1 Tax=Zizania palustris TaxID=103762 RepID=A0A8J5VZD0_ZIZPA|nr:hypothetical protein GUJ93_ZPchr0004g38692 [Zizania palustris]
MDNAQYGDEELGGGSVSGRNANAVAEVVEASNDSTKLPRVLVASGVGQAAGALYLALFRPPAGLFVLRNKRLLYTYYGVLVSIILFGVAHSRGEPTYFCACDRFRTSGGLIIFGARLMSPAGGGMAACSSGTGTVSCSTPVSYGVLVAVVLIVVAEA